MKLSSRNEMNDPLYTQNILSKLIYILWLTCVLQGWYTLYYFFWVTIRIVYLFNAGALDIFISETLTTSEKQIEN